MSGEAERVAAHGSIEPGAYSLYVEVADAKHNLSQGSPGYDFAINCPTYIFPYGRGRGS